MTGHARSRLDSHNDVWNKLFVKGEMMFLYMSVVVAIGLAVIWAGIADERNVRRTGKTLPNQAVHGSHENWPEVRLRQFAKPSDTDSRATINGSPYATADTGSGQRAA